LVKLLTQRRSRALEASYYMSNYLGKQGTERCIMALDLIKNIGKDELKLEENEDARSTSASSEGGNGDSSSEISSGTELDPALTLASATETVVPPVFGRLGSLWSWVWCRRRAPQLAPLHEVMPEECADCVVVRATRMQEAKLRSRTAVRPQQLRQRSKPWRTTQTKVAASDMKDCASFIPPPPGLAHLPGRQVNNREPVLPVGPPPGLPLPFIRGPKSSSQHLGSFKPPPGLPSPVNLPQASPEYTVQGFRREATNILKDLKIHKNVGLAVLKVRLQGVPCDRQAAEFADILTMVLEETRGPARRVCVAFVGGLTKAFELENCILGLQAFFKEIYEDLQIEVPDLSKRIASELLPTLKPLLEAKDFARIASLRDSCT